MAPFAERTSPLAVRRVAWKAPGAFGRRALAVKDNGECRGHTLTYINITIVLLRTTPGGGVNRTFLHGMTSWVSSIRKL